MPKAVIVSASDTADTRFGKGRRLHLPPEFAAVLGKRRVLRGEVFDLHLGEEKSSPTGRLGLIVPKRLARAASQRNAVKRQGREAFRLFGAGMKQDVVLRLKMPLALDGGGFRQLKRSWRREIETLLARAAAKSL